jgi:hypothetical protein
MTLMIEMLHRLRFETRTGTTKTTKMTKAHEGHESPRISVPGILRVLLSFVV